MQSDRTLFISYRRADSSGWAGRLQADLRSRLGADAQVFMDVDAIPAGEDFARAIEDAVSRSHALVALIGPGWVTARDAQGRRRLDDPNDLVRIEIEAALRRGIRVIPTLAGGASLPSPDVLPETLRALTRRQALRLDNETWNLGLRRLVRAIEHPRRPLTWFTWLRWQPARRVVIVGLLLAMFVTVGLLLARFAFVVPAPGDDVPQAEVRSVSAKLAGFPVWAHFSHPRRRPGGDYTIHNELRRLIDKAPRGSSIKGTIYSLSIDSVADRLVRAQSRGVQVVVVIDGKNADSTNSAVATIKRLTHHKFCQNRNDDRSGSCISTSADGDLHTKMFTFTVTEDPNGVRRRNVSWFGSANLTLRSTKTSNNAVTVYGDAALMNGLNANFMDMWNQRHYPGSDYYDAGSGRGYYLAAAADAYASPEGAGQTDTIVTRLNDLTPDGNCRLRIGVALVTAERPHIVNLVRDFRAAGCRVSMVVDGESTKGIRMHRHVYEDLLRAGVALRRADNVHDKFFVAYGKYGPTYRYQVYTGSQNWTQDALNENDEIFVKMAPETGTAHPLYDAFAAHFDDSHSQGVECRIDSYPCR